ncbi:MAG: SapC family protein [Magnetococcales bacterium]|nr:SapC family protein [Magnetococcales bacterium]
MTYPVLYGNPVQLNKKDFSSIGITTWGKGLSFTAGAHQVPALCSEFAVGCLHYPIVFSRDASGLVVPLFLLGYREGENLYLDKHGKWLVTYIPSYVRQYPFILSDDNKNGGEAQVWIDRDGFVQDESGERLFDEAGENSPYLNKVFDLLRYSMASKRLTQVFCARLLELDLFVDQVANIALDDGSQYAVQGMMMVDEIKLNQLDDDTILELFRSGFLGWINCHMISRANLQGLLTLKSKSTP